ncbi:MAG: M13 family metallopeptidase, partial [Ekhidna sp.]
IYSRDVGFLKAIEKVLTQSKPDDIKAYLRWRLLDGFAPYLNHKFVKADFDFFGKHLRGEQELSSREARVINVMRHEALGDIIGKIYVEKHFASQTKKEVADMANNIKEAFANRINNLSWMSNSTKQNALSKLRLLRIKIGHPEAWPDFTKLHINGDSVHSSYVQNVMNCFRFQFDKKVKALNQPINTEEWRMSPVTINAFYNALFNEIGIPAAILQPPFYIAGANVAINYGGIGSIIAHEISHGFDSQGKKFDADGNLNNWWTPTDLASFDEKAEKFARQIDTYEPMDNVFLNGQLVLHESIADLAGVAIAFDGLQRHIKKSTKRELVNGYSAEQLFFISYAASKRAIYTDEVLLGRIQIDAHMPDKYRING